MKRKTLFLRNILGVNLIISILASSIGREIFIQEYVNYYFWLSLGLSLGFGLLSIFISNNQRSG